MTDVSALGNDSQQDREPERYQRQYAELIDTAAHDLDAPLRKLAVLVEKVVTECGSEQQEKISSYVPRIYRCLGDMRSLIDQLASLSRVGLGPGTISTFSLDTIVHEAWQDVAPEAAGKNAQFDTGALPGIEGDRAQYRQLFKNLFQNALTFGKKDIFPVISVAAAAPEDEEKRRYFPAGNGSLYHKITVTDNGIGFRPEDAEKIFRPFVRLHGKSAYPGSGIGLALCKRIAENHHGVIYADGQEDAGARFILIIPQTRNQN